MRADSDPLKRSTSAARKELEVLAAVAGLLAWMAVGSAKVYAVHDDTPMSGGAAPVPSASRPELPRLLLDTSPPVQTGQTITVPAGGDLQRAINNAKSGDTIELAAGATFTGNFVLPKKTGTGWLWIRTSAYSMLPAPGQRLVPGDKGLARIVSPNTGPAFTFDVAASFYRFSGIEITTTWSTTTATNYGLVAMGTVPSSDSSATSLAQLPSDVTFDRCFIHGTPSGNVRRGIAANAARLAVVDSYLSDFHEVGADSQAIASWNGSGPFKIVNNYLEGAGENVMFGGSDPAITNLMPSDIEFRRNHVAKPLTWKGDDPSYAGIAWSVKNLFELKNARRVLVDGNVFERNWAQSQSGFGILITPRNQGGNCPWCGVQDVTFTHNKVRWTSAAINVLGSDTDHQSTRTARVLFENNLLLHIDGKWGGGSNGTAFQLLGGIEHLTIRSNTYDGGMQGQYGMAFVYVSGSPASQGAEITKNIANGAGGIDGDDKGWGAQSIDFYLPRVNLSKNVLYGPYPTPGGGVVSQYGGYQEGNSFPPNQTAVRFVDPANDNYKLLPDSPHQGLGADIDALNAATAGVE
jgi:hypothetical protein